MNLRKNRFSDNKALIKETGEIFDVEQHYIISTMTITWKSDEIKEIAEKTILEYKKKNADDLPPGKYYVLTNKKTYESKDLIVGIKEIRDYKLKKFL